MKVIIGTILFLSSVQSFAFGLSVSPTTVMFDSKNMFGHVELSNTSEHSKTFVVEFEEPTLGTCFKVSPREIVIALGQIQVVRMQYICEVNSLPADPMVFFVEQLRAQRTVISDSQLDFRLRLGLKVKLQNNPIQSLF